MRLLKSLKNSNINRAAHKYSMERFLYQLNAKKIPKNWNSLSPKICSFFVKMKRHWKKNMIFMV